MPDYLYVAFRAGGVHVIDWTDVANMFYVTSMTKIWHGWSGVYGSGSKIYCATHHADNNTTQDWGVMSAIFDVSDPSSPVLESKQYLVDYKSSSNYGIDVCAAYVFTALNGSLYLCVIDRQGLPGMRVLNVDDPLNPHLVAYFGGDAEGGMFANGIVNNGMYFSAGILYVSDWNGLHVFDFLNDPESPVYVGSFGGSSYEGIAVVGNSMYVGRKSSPYGLTLFDISTPGVPVKVKDFNANQIGMDSISGEYGVELAISGLNLVVATRPDAVSNIHVYDISSTESIVHVGSTNLRALVLPGSSSVKVGMAVKDGYIVHSAGEAGLAIVELSTVSPAPFSPFSLSGDVYVSDPYYIPFDLYGTGIVSLPSVADVIPGESNFEVSVDVWRGFGVETGEIVRLFVGNEDGKYYKVRGVEKDLMTGVTKLTLYPHNTKKVGYLASGLIGLEPGWSVGMDVDEVEASGFWYGDEEIEGGVNDRIVFSVDGGSTWLISSVQAGTYTDFDSIASEIVSKMNAAIGWAAVTGISRNSEYVVEISHLLSTLKFVTDVAPSGVSDDDFMRSVRFLCWVFGMDAGVVREYTTSPAVLDNPVLFSFDPVDISRYG
ncbi:MAG: hypothetical protein D6816_10065 [Bacteroidetes bacterium]|nr:MAG: hypothetical protein D6816_10065 [Bacteroidota bacterium]